MKKTNIFVKIISIIISILLCILLTMTVFVFNFSNYLTTKNINKVLKKTTITKTLKEIDKNAEETLKGPIMDTLYSEFLKKGISKKQADTIIDSTIGKEFITTYTNNVMNNIKNNANKELTESDLEKIVSNNVDAIIESSNGLLTDTDKDKIIEATKLLAPKIINYIPKSTTVLEKLDNSTLNIIKFITNDKLKTTLIINIIILVIVMILIQLSLIKWLLYTSIPILTTALTSLLIGFSLKPILYLILDNSNIFYRLIILFANPIKSNFITIGLIGILIFIIEIVLFNLLKRSKKVA